MNAFFEMIEADFMQRAFLAGGLIALCCAVLGVFLVLRRYAMIGEGLAHSSIAAVGVALVLGITPLAIALPLAAASSYLIIRLSRRTAVYGEIAVGLVSATSMALGVLLASIGRGFNMDLYSYLVGNINTISADEVWLAVSLSGVTLVIISLFYYELFVIAYDEDFARVSGRKTGFLNSLLAVLTGVTVVLGVRLMGAILVTSLIIFPAVTSLQFARAFRQALVFAGLLGLVSVIAGIIVAYFLDFPPGATIVLVNAVFFLVVLAGKRLVRRRG